MIHAFLYFVAKITICAKSARGLQKSPNMYGISLVLTALAHWGRAGRKSAESCKNRAKYFAFSVKMLILCKMQGIYRKSSFCALPKHWYSLSFIGRFSSGRGLFQVAPPFYQKGVEFQHF